MPRLVNSVPKYRKHRGSGQAIVSIGGRDIYLGPHGSKASRVEYDRLIGEWLASGRSPTYLQPEAALTIVELLAAYVKHAKAYYGAGPRGEYANMRRAVAPLNQLYKSTEAADFGPLQFKAIRQRLVDAGHARTTVNAAMQRIVRVFRWGAAEGLIPASVPQTLSMIPGLRKGRSGARESTPIKPVDPRDVDATLPHLSQVVGSMVQIQRLCGARPGEICALRPADVDRSGDVWEARLREHKTAHHNRERVLYFGPKAQDVLRPYLLRPAETYCFSPQEAVAQLRSERTANRKTPLSCGNRAGASRKRRPKRQPSERYTTQSYGVAIARACESADVSKWTPNQLRHLVATVVRREFGLDAAQVILGHSEIGVTQLYAEKDRNRAIEVVAKIG